MVWSMQVMSSFADFFTGKPKLSESKARFYTYLRWVGLGSSVLGCVLSVVACFLSTTSGG